MTLTNFVTNLSNGFIDIDVATRDELILWLERNDNIVECWDDVSLRGLQAIAWDVAISKACAQ